MTLRMLQRWQLATLQWHNDPSSAIFTCFEVRRSLDGSGVGKIVPKLYEASYTRVLLIVYTSIFSSKNRSLESLACYV